MGFYGPEPFSKAKATYVWTGYETPGFFTVEVEGCAPNFTTGIQLIRDPHWVGGLKVDVMGWTGPVAEGCTDYKVTNHFNGEYQSEILVSGSNGVQKISVQEIPYTEPAR